MADLRTRAPWVYAGWFSRWVPRPVVALVGAVAVLAMNEVTIQGIVTRRQAAPDARSIAFDDAARTRSEWVPTALASTPASRASCRPAA